MKLPSDIESENVILSICLSKPDSVPRVREFMEGRHFYDEQNRRIFLQMERFFQEGKACAAQDLAHKAHVSVQKVSELIGYTPVVDPKPYCQALLDLWRRREAIRLTDRFQSELIQKKGAEETIAAFTASLIGLCQGSDTRLFSLDESMTSAYRTICQAVETGKFPGVPLPLQRLNEVVGGLRRGNLITIGSRPGVGKTAIAVNFTQHLIGADYKVLFVSAEMTKEEIASRMLSIASGVSADLLINKPNHLLQGDLKRVAEVVSDLTATNCFILDEGNVRADRLFVATGSAAQQMGGLDLIVVDYLQILEGRSRKHLNSKADYLAEVTKELKRLAKRYNVPVLALAQLNREAEGEKRPSLRNFADTSQIEKESDVAMILWRGKQEHQRWDYQLVVEKNRNGQTGVIRLDFDEQRMYFTEAD